MSNQIGTYFRYLKTLPFLLVGLLIPVLAFAAETEHEHHGSPSDLIPYWIHFAAFVVILYFLIKRPITEAVVARREGIDEAVGAGRRQLADAEHKLSLAQKRFASLATAIESLKQEIASDAEREAKQLLSEALERAARIKSNADNAAVSELKAAQLKMRNEVAERAIELAREKIKARVNLDSDRALRSSALSGVGNLAN
jgi:F-type H+-transporting ATPase subunit b